MAQSNTVSCLAQLPGSGIRGHRDRDIAGLSAEGVSAAVSLPPELPSYLSRGRIPSKLAQWPLAWMSVASAVDWRLRSGVRLWAGGPPQHGSRLITAAKESANKVQVTFSRDISREATPHHFCPILVVRSKDQRPPPHTHTLRERR